MWCWAQHASQTGRSTAGNIGLLGSDNEGTTGVLGPAVLAR